MHITRLFFLVILFYSSLSLAQPGSLFERYIGDESNDQSYAIIQTSDGDIVMAGYTNALGTADILLTKTDAEGEILWTKALGGASAEFAHQIIETADGGYAITGWTVSYGAGDDDIFLTKTDMDGTVEWTKTYGRDDADRGRAVRQTNDGGYIVLGHTDGFGLSLNDLYLIRTDAQGDTIWTKTIGSTSFGNENGWWIEETSDGGFISTGNTSIGPGFTNLLLVKYDSMGDTIWTRSIGGEGGQCGGYCVKELSTGGYMATGWTNAFGAGAKDVYTVRTDAAGALLWSKTFGGVDNEDSQSMLEIDEDNFIIAGITESFGSVPPSSGDNGYVLSISADGELNQSTVFGGSADEYIYGMDRAQDGGVVLTGWSTSYGAGSFDILLVKTDVLVFGGCEETIASTVTSDPPTEVGSPDLTQTFAFTQTMVTEVDFSVDQFLEFENFTLCYIIIDDVDEWGTGHGSNMEIAPNPVLSGSQVILQFQDWTNEDLDLILYDTRGRIVMKERTLSPVEGKLWIDLPDLEIGLYTLTLINTEGERYSKKLSVE